jgi:hypothetical protein
LSPKKTTSGFSMPPQRGQPGTSKSSKLTSKSASPATVVICADCSIGHSLPQCLILS